MATAAIMTQGDESALERFRADARKWIHDNFPPNLKGRIPMEFRRGVGAYAADPDYLRWKAAVAERGWGAPAWPTQWGGGGLSRAEVGILDEELAASGAFNPIFGFGMGTLMLGPTLLESGTDAQKAEHIPPIVRGEREWCQGYSEPGAGSDLASLRTQAVDMGDHFLVNGQKIWTSGAHHADWCFCLVRTDNSRKHEGISFLLIDMKAPGVEARPIKLISGDSLFCEVFLTDVKVPKDNLVGPLNGGWTIGKRLLQFERAGQGNRSSASHRPSVAHSVSDIAKAYLGTDAGGRIADPDLRVRIADHQMNLAAMRLTLRRVTANSEASTASTISSILKNANVRNNQNRDELLVEILGFQGIGWEGAGFSQAEIDITRNWLGDKAQSIYGGSSEVQNNIISKRILGLPEQA